MKSAIFGILFVIIAVAAKDGTISVYNSGGYVAKFTIDYDYNGSRHSDDSGDFRLGMTKSLRVPDGATNIVLKVEEYWFPDTLAIIFTKSFSSPETKCYEIYGTTIHPEYREIGC